MRLAIRIILCCLVLLGGAGVAASPSPTPTSSPSPSPTASPPPTPATPTPGPVPSGSPGTDIWDASGVIIILKVTPASDPITGKTVEVTGPILDQTAQIIERRLSFADILDCRVSREGPDIAIYGPEDLDVVKVAAVIKKTGRLEFKEKIYDPKLKKLRWRTVMDGRYVKSARAEFNTSGEPVVLFELTEVGTAIFAKVTKRNVGKVIGIFFEGRLLSDPIVREPITGGSVQISGGDLGHDGCREIADYLNAGSLRVTLSVKEVRKIPKKTE